MSQTPSVNVLNPVQGAEGLVDIVSRNQIAKAEIEARHRISTAQLEAESIMQKARLEHDSEQQQRALEVQQQEGAANRASQSADYAALNTARAQGDERQIQAQKDRDDREHQRVLELEKLRTEAEARALGAAASGADVDFSEAERLKDEADRIEGEIAMAMAGGEQDQKKLSLALGGMADDLQQYVETQERTLAETGPMLEAAFADTLLKGVQNLPTFMQELASNTPGGAAVFPSPLGVVGLAKSAVRNVGEAVSPGFNQTPSSELMQQQEETNPLFSGSALVQESLQAAARMGAIRPAQGSNATPEEVARVVGGVANALRVAAESGDASVADKAMQAAAQTIDGPSLQTALRAMGRSEYFSNAMRALRVKEGQELSLDQRQQKIIKAAGNSASMMSRIGNQRLEKLGLGAPDYSKLKRTMEDFVGGTLATTAPEGLAAKAKEMGLDQPGMAAMLDGFVKRLGKFEPTDVRAAKVKELTALRDAALTNARNASRRGAKGLVGAAAKSKQAEADALGQLIGGRP